MRSRNNQILTGSKGVDMQISAPFSCSHAIGSRPMAFFHTRTCPRFKTVSLRVRKPLLFPLRPPQAGGHGCFPMNHIREAKRRLFSSKSTLFIFTGRRCEDGCIPYRKDQRLHGHVQLSSAGYVAVAESERAFISFALKAQGLQAHGTEIWR